MEGKTSFLAVKLAHFPKLETKTIYPANKYDMKTELSLNTWVKLKR